MTTPTTQATSRLRLQQVGFSDAWGLYDTQKTREDGLVRLWTGRHARGDADEHLDRIQRRQARATRARGRGSR